MSEKIVLITGASAGIGLATASLYAAKGWRVIAAARNAGLREKFLPDSPLIDIADLDVSSRASIARLGKYTAEKYGKIDVLVNNAGYSLAGPFEASSPEDADRQMAVNVTGLMDMCREFIPLLRKGRGGVIVNVSSAGGRMAFPYYSVYTASKWAVEGFSEGLTFELQKQGIRVKIIEPGTVRTDFFGRNMVLARGKGAEHYPEYYAQFEENLAKTKKISFDPAVVAAVIYRASLDKSARLRYPAGFMAAVTLMLRKLLPEPLFNFIVKSVKKA